MICPHCSTAARFEWQSTSPIKYGEDGEITILTYSTCPNCTEIVVNLKSGYPSIKSFIASSEEEMWETMIYPKESNFLNSNDIPRLYLDDYEEAVKVLPVSPKASAALTRRLLQNILREEFKIVENNLYTEIQKFIELSGIPSHLTDAVDAIRSIGNLAAHPAKNKNTGEIVSVENGEAEWLIEVIEALFDFAFIQPIKLERRRAELNLKLAEIDKLPLKKQDKKA